MNKYGIPFEYKRGTPMLTICLSTDIPFETLFGLPLMIGKACVPYLNAM